MSLIYKITCLFICAAAAPLVLADNVTPQEAEAFLQAHNSPLLSGSETDHVKSFYYFGSHGHRTLIGLERVRGDDYSQHYSLMVFENKDLLGYYAESPALPLMITESGVLSFPRGNEVSDIILIQQNEFPPLCLGSKPCIQWEWQPGNPVTAGD